MKKVTAPTPFAGSALGKSLRVCVFFNSDEEGYRVLLPFIKNGFECGDKATHVVNIDQHADHLHRLTALGIDTQAGRQSGQFELSTNTETYLCDGRFDQNRMLSAFEELASKTSKEGFHRSRIVSDMDWAVETGSHVDNLVEFESRVNDVWLRHQDAVICSYNPAKFGGATVIDIMRTHPTIIVGGIVQQNPFFVPREIFLRELCQRRAGQSAVPTTTA
jgi:hypothetical protein